MGGTAILEQQETAPAVPATAAPEEAEVSLARRFFNPHTLVSLVAAVAIIVFLLTRFDIDLGATWEEIKSSDPWLLAAAVVAFYLSFPLRGVRWHPAPAAQILRRNLWIYGVGGILIPFAGIKVLDMLITLLRLA